MKIFNGALKLFPPAKLCEQCCVLQEIRLGYIGRDSVAAGGDVAAAAQRSMVLMQPYPLPATLLTLGL